MSDPSEELMGLLIEAKELSAYRFTLKRKKNRVKVKTEKERLAEEIRIRQ